MKLGQQITYVDAKGKKHGATVTAVPDTGASGNKVVDLTYADGAVARVLHGNDRVKGQGYWLLVSEVENPPDRRAPEEKQPIALAEAEASGALPPASRRTESAKAPARSSGSKRK